MRKLVYGINITIDGCCDHTHGAAGTDIHDYFTQRMRESGLIVYGRKTYELMVPFWPDMARDKNAPTKALADFAEAFSALPIVVFSRTLQKVDDPRTRIVSTGLREEILKLKQQPGKDITIGGVDLPSQLMAMGLIDEYHFVVHPVLAGKGRRLLEGMDLEKDMQLKLVESKVLESGCVAMRYVKE